MQSLCRKAGYCLLGVTAVGIPMNVILLLKGHPGGALGLAAGAAALWAISKIFEYANTPPAENS